MAITNTELLQALDTAFKNITDINEFGDSLLQADKLDRFVHQLQHRTRLLPITRMMVMDAQIVDIDRVAFNNRILRSGSGSDGTTHRTLSANEFATISTATNQLIAQELQAVASLRDRALRRNIERGGFENTLIELFGQAAGRDLEEYALLADKAIPHATDDVLSKTDGWVRRAANKLYGREWDDTEVVPGDFNVGDATWPRNLFQAMLEALPKQYLQDESEWVFAVDWDIIDAYRTFLGERATDLGDTAHTQSGELTYKGIPLLYVPMLNRASAVDLTEEAEVTRDRIEGTIALLTHPDNMAWGVFHEVTIEREREAKERRTDFVLAFEGDAHYEDENAVVAALIDKAEPGEE